MTSILYAIVDAGGNIYPGTFAKSKDSAWFRHVPPGPEPLPEGATWPRISEAVECGDRAVRCLIETSENVKVTLLK